MPYWTEGSALAFGAAMAAWIGLWLVSLTRRKGPDDAGGGQRDARSVAGIAVQGVGIGVAWFGPIRLHVGFAPADWLAAAPAVALATGGLLLFWWSIATMGKNWALVARTRGDHELVQTGPFALVRNPIYVAIAAMLAATAIGAGHAANLLVAIPIYLIGTMMRVTLEEKLLSATFGAAYDDYRRRVRRFVPFLV